MGNEYGKCVSGFNQFDVFTLRLYINTFLYTFLLSKQF